MSPLNRLENWLFQKILLKIVSTFNTKWLMLELFKMHRRVFFEDNIYDHQDNILKAYEHALDHEKLMIGLRYYGDARE